MNCQRAERCLLMQSTGELSRRLSVQLQEHLRQCSPCSTYAHDLQMMHATFPLGHYDAHSDIVARVLAVASQSPIPIKARLVHLPRYIAALAACLVIGISLWTACRDSGSKPPVVTIASTNTHLTDVSAILFAITDMELWIDESHEIPSSRADINEVARQILITQGLYVDFAEEASDNFNSHEDPQPTTLLWRNNPSPLEEKCG